MPVAEAFSPVVLLDLPAEVAPVTDVRGAALVSSFKVLGEMGHRDAIVHRFPDGYAAMFEGITASTWVPIDVAMVYYRIVDALDLPSEVIVSIGAYSAERAQSAFLATLLRGLRGVVTPATVLARMDRFWTRSARGGGPRAVQVGRCAVRIEVHAAEFLELRYNRIALMGYYQHALSPAAKKLDIRELRRPGPKAAAWMVTWE